MQVILGTIFLGAVFLGTISPRGIMQATKHLKGNFPQRQFPGGYCKEAIFFRGNCPDTMSDIDNDKIDLKDKCFLFVLCKYVFALTNLCLCFRNRQRLTRFTVKKSIVNSFLDFHSRSFLFLLLVVSRYDVLYCTEHRY